METSTLKRQFITDAQGNPVGVILPIEEWALIKDLLDHVASTVDDADKLALMEKAAQDPLYLQDLRETMAAFAQVDADWWEPA